MEVFINGNTLFILNCSKADEVKSRIEKELGLEPNEYYLLSDGKRVNKFSDVKCSKLHIIPRVLGGKGGFGSMLRAIGAQIEKTTNREACRDLSGRRLRDINEEQRLKNWINQQAEREKEAKERKQKKLERLCERPKHEFKDEQYDKERSELPEIVEDAVLRGLQASCSTKRKSSEGKSVVKKKKAKLWVDDELEDDLSSSESGDEESDAENSNESNESTKNNKKNTDKVNETESSSKESISDSGNSNEDHFDGNRSEDGSESIVKNQEEKPEEEKCSEIQKEKEINEKI